VKFQWFYSVLIMLCTGALTSECQELEKFQIPESEIKNLSTGELIQEYYNSFFPGYLLAYNSVQAAYDHEYAHYNGFRELLERADVCEELLAKYINMDCDYKDPKWDRADIGRFTFSFMYIETLLGQDAILNKMTDSELLLLSGELLKKYEAKLIDVETHGVLGIQFLAYTMARLVQVAGSPEIKTKLFADPDLQHLLETGRLRNNVFLGDLVQAVNDLSMK